MKYIFTLILFCNLVFILLLLTHTVALRFGKAASPAYTILCSWNLISSQDMFCYDGEGNAFFADMVQPDKISVVNGKVVKD